jgi:sugar transferase (PEP-CTERM system associated)
MIQIFDRYISPKAIALAAMESGLIALALVCAVKVRFWDSSVEFESFVGVPEFLIQTATFVAALQVCFYYCDLYDFATFRRRNEQVVAVAQSLGSACLLLGILYFIFPVLVLGRGIFFISITLVPPFVIASRVLLDRVWRATAPIENVLIIGGGPLASTVGDELANRRDLNLRIAGFIVTDDSDGKGGTLAGAPVLGSNGDLIAVSERNHISRIIVALEDRRNALPIRDLVRLRVKGVRVEEAHSTITALTGRVWLETVKPSWFVFSDGFHRSAITLVLKRIMDLVAGIVGLVLCLPLMLVVAAATRLGSRGPVIYRQTRVGLRGVHFEVLKFRSMRADAEQGTGAMWATAEDKRITRVGRFIRKYRLDELPQFVNVIRGDMSLVGPRPERPAFVEELRTRLSYYDERHTVRPGITGWAQVRYKYGSTVEDAVRKLEYDLFYLKNMSVFFDLHIIFDTIRIVITGWGSR